MIHFIILFLMAFSSGYSFFCQRRSLQILQDLLENQSNARIDIDVRISNLQDHVRSTEKGIYLLKDQLSRIERYHTTAPNQKEQIQAILEEFKNTLKSKE